MIDVKLQLFWHSTTILVYLVLYTNLLFHMLYHMTNSFVSKPTIIK